MISAAPVLGLFILTCASTSGYGRILRFYSPPLKTPSLLATKTMCPDCTRITELVSNIISHPETEDLLQDTIGKVCLRLPEGRVIKDCLDFVQNYLPVVLQRFITSDKREICMKLGLCAAQLDHQTSQFLSVGLQDVQHLKGNAEELQVSPQCTFCLFIIKKLEDMLPKERTEESVVKTLEKICDHLPDHYKEQCNDLLEKYGKEIIDFLLTSATPHTICMLLHMCLVQDAPVQVPAVPPECKTCKLLMILSQTHLGQNSTETQMTALLWRTCHLHPNALPGCEPFIQSRVTTLVNILSKQEEALNACQMIFCGGRK